MMGPVWAAKSGYLHLQRVEISTPIVGQWEAETELEIYMQKPYSGKLSRSTHALEMKETGPGKGVVGLGCSTNEWRLQPTSQGSGITL